MIVKYSKHSIPLRQTTYSIYYKKFRTLILKYEKNRKCKEKLKYELFYCPFVTTDKKLYLYIVNMDGAQH